MLYIDTIQMKLMMISCEFFISNVEMIVCLAHVVCNFCSFHIESDKSLFTMMTIRCHKHTRQRLFQLRDDDDDDDDVRSMRKVSWVSIGAVLCVQ